MDLSAISKEVVSLSLEAGSFLRSMLGSLKDSMIIQKGQMDFVTEVDKRSEELIVKGLAKLIPSAGFIAEEGTRSNRGDRFNWVIDPLDGTTNFIHGVSPFAVCIALMDQGDPVVGVINDPMSGECFSAWRNGPALLNGSEIRVSQRAQLSDALLATGFPYTDFTLIEEYMGSLRDLMASTHGIRRLGSAAMDLAYVACGRYDGFWEYHLKPWDVAAGTVIIGQAGGTVCDFYGGKDYLFGQTYVATNSLIHKELMAVLHNHFNRADR